MAVDEPEVLVGGDVREVPDERRHQRVDLALEVLARERRDERERVLARGLEPRDDLSRLPRMSTLTAMRWALGLPARSGRYTSRELGLSGARLGAAVRGAAGRELR